jgi:hypothetical protein
LNEQEIQSLLGAKIWWLGGLALLFLIRRLIESAIEGLMIFIGNDYNNDDTVWIDGRPGRIIRVGLYKTVFFIYELKTDPFTGHAEVSGGNKLVIQNSALKELRIEKPLANIDISRYDRSMNDPSCRRNGNDES